MNSYLLVPFVSAVVYFVLASMILSRDARHPANRLAALLCLAAGHWAACELMWGAATSESAAYLLVRLSAPGWMSLGPLACHLFLVITASPLLARRGTLAVLYGPPLVFCLLDMATPIFHTGVVPVSWGWAYRVTPWFLAPYLWCGVTLLLGIALARGYLSGLRSSRERMQVSMVAGGMLIPLVGATFTDALLPFLEIDLPRVGCSSSALLALSIVWGFQRYGYSLVAPGGSTVQVFACLPDGVAMLTFDARVQLANPALIELSGRSAKELEACAVADLFSEVPDLTPGTDALELETQLLRADGVSIPVSVTTTPFSDKRGEELGRVLVVRDLRELSNLRKRLVVSDRLAAVGQLAAGIAHEINNPTAFVRANLATMEELLGEMDAALPVDRRKEVAPLLHEGRELLAESREGVDRVISIVRDVKELSDAGVGGRQRVRLPQLLESVTRVASSQLPGGCALVSGSLDLPEIDGSPQELQQVLLNLVVNAIQALEGRGCIEIGGRVEGDHVVLSIQDEGSGIERDHLERIFDPFFTTQPVGEGTGLGLSISYQIVKAHGGEIRVESEPGVGSCFEVRLPIAAEPTP